MSSLFWYNGHELLLPDIVRAENCHLFDSEGRRYVDLESGVWCTPIGHGHPRVLGALVRQSARLAHTGYCYSSAIVEEAAGQILALAGLQGGRCVFLCSGGEAIEYGVRVAQAVSERPLLMTMADSYFGAYGSASKRKEDEWFAFDWMGCIDCDHSEGCGSRCERWASIPFQRIGGFLLEPGSSSGLVRFPPERLVRGIVERVRADGGLYLVNEVTTGVGRTGRWFGYEHYGLSPDVIALGKGIGNGYPVSVALFSPEVVRRIGEGGVKYAQSHQNDPLGAAVALEVVRAIRDEDLIRRGVEIAGLLVSGLRGIGESRSRIREIRSRGLMIALDLADDPGASYSDWTQRELVRRGYVLARRPGLNVLRIDPALTIERSDIEGFIRTFDEVLAEGSPR